MTRFHFIAARIIHMSRRPPVHVMLLIMFACAIGTHAGRFDVRCSTTVLRGRVDGVSSRALRRVLAGCPGAPDSLRSSLDSLGFFGARWDTLGVDTLVLVTGVRAVVDTITVSVDSADLHVAIAPRRFPRPYDAAEITAAGTDILRQLASAGRPFAVVGFNVQRRDWAGVPRLRVEIAVAVDDYMCAGGIKLSGSGHTRDRQLFRDIAPVTGGPFDYRVVERSRERLLSREYIDSVEIGPPVVLPRVSDSGMCAGVASVVVPVRVVDRRGLTFDGALGLESDAREGVRLNGMLDASLGNVLGAGEKVSVSYRADDTYQKLGISLSKVHVGSWPLIVTGRFGLEIRSAEYASLEGAATALYEFGAWRAGAGARAMENTRERVDSAAGATWHVYGADMRFERRTGGRWEQGRTVTAIALRTGIDYVQRDSSNDTRWRIDFSASAHQPFGRYIAIGATLFARSIFTDEQTLIPSEMIRLGGYRSLRGYPDDAYALRNAAWVQIEYIVYPVKGLGAYIFTDGGVGSREGLERSADWTGLFGYGAGIRVPVVTGTASVEWGRSIDDTRGFGRVHVRFNNRFGDENP